MTHMMRAPCDEEAIRSGKFAVTVAPGQRTTQSGPVSALGATSPRAHARSHPAVSAAAPVWTLVAAILGSSMAFIDGSVVNVALPVIQVDLHATASDAQWVIEAYLLFLAALILVGGALGDRYGRRLVFASGIALFTLASIACGLAPNILTLIVARAIQGIGGALLTPGSLALISAAYPPERRGRAIGLWSGLTSITSAFGPVLGGALVAFSWRLIFFLNIPLAVITLVILFRRTQESRESDISGPLDWPGALLATLGLGGIVFGLIEASTYGLFAPIALVPAGVGMATLIAFGLVETHSKTPMIPFTLFRSPTFTGANLLTLLLYAAVGAVTYFVPFNLIRAQGYPPVAAGAAFLPFVLLMFILSGWSGGLVDRFGAKLPLIVGPIIAGVGFLLFALPTLHANYWVTFFPAVVVLGLGMAVTVAPLTTAVMGAVSVDRAGAASGVNNAVARTASLLSIAALGIVIAAVFNHALESALATLHLSPALHHALDAQRNKTIGAQVPPNTPPALAAQLHHAITSAFVAGFRVVMLVCAGLAFASAGIAGILIEGKPRRVG